MKPCRACLGVGYHDCRSEDALFERTLPPVVLEGLSLQGLHPIGILRCGECDGTGQITDERDVEMAVEAHAAVAAIVARMEHEEKCQRL